ncbi:MAG: FAD-binding oxidoreductase, partial [Anaerolineales bacterium]|nr:FAD-binding oxidoreductase [Anaerolineales bacterium]
MAELPTQAQVVIIGGGVGGCSIAYHLTKLGWKDVVVLERYELTSGSTWHSAGLVGQMRSDANLTRMMNYSTNLYRELKKETGQDTGWREVGGEAGWVFVGVTGDTRSAAKAEKPSRAGATNVPGGLSRSGH